VPARNVIKQYLESGYYHVYNRGVAKNLIFRDDQDYSVFLSYLKEYLSPSVPPSPQEIKEAGRLYLRKNYLNEIELIVYCLMPNHFHLLLKQRQPRSMESFMRSLTTRYSVYFNRKYNRVGHLFQGIYRAIIVTKEEYFLWLSRYIHLNPLDILGPGKSLSSYPYSTYAIYLRQRKVEWVLPERILSMVKDYRRFVEGARTMAPADFEQFTLESVKG